MKKFTVEVSRTDWYTLVVEAEDKDEAREQALEDIYQMDENDLESARDKDNYEGFLTCACSEITEPTKLFSVDVAIYATAYVQATGPEHAKNLLEMHFMNTGLELREDGLINGDHYDDIMSDPSLVITLSPAMTVDHILHDPEQVYPEP